jgi:hypothetical protein
MRPVDAWVVRPLARLLAYQGRFDGRLVMLTALSVYVLAVALAWQIWQVNLWPWLGVPPGPSVFFDARNVLAAVECHRLGYDPLIENPCDPWQRPMFYPRVWLALQWFGLDQSHTNAFGAVIALLCVASLCLLLGKISVGEGSVFALAVCSPAVMFAFQRGNMDVLLFAVLAGSVVLWHRGTPASRVLSPTVVLLAAFGKLYPVFGLAAYFVLGSRRAAMAAAACCIVFLLYAAITFQDVLTVARTATQGQYYSYGARILLGLVYHAVVGQNWEGGSMLAQGLTLIPVAASLGGLWFGARRLFAPAPGAEPPRTGLLLGFYLGALIYLGTFMVFKNYDYRLVYLLLVLPQLCTWLSYGQPGNQLRRLAGLGLGCVLLELWIGALSEPLGLADELVSWALAGLLVALVAATASPATSQKPIAEGQNR